MTNSEAAFWTLTANAKITIATAIPSPAAEKNPKYDPSCLVITDPHAEKLLKGVITSHYCLLMLKTMSLKKTFLGWSHLKVCHTRGYVLIVQIVIKWSLVDLSSIPVKKCWKGHLIFPLRSCPCFLFCTTSRCVMLQVGIVYLGQLGK